MCDIVKEIKRVIQKKGYSAYKTARLSGIAESHLSKILNRKQKPNLDTLYTLAKGLGVDVVEFFGYEKTPRPIIEVNADDHFQHVPLLADPASLGSGLEIDETKVLEEPCLVHKRVLRRGGKYRAIFVKGDSMSPVLNDGDIVAIDVKERNPEKLKDKLVACHTGNYEVTIKVLCVHKDVFHFKPINPECEKENVPMVTPKKDGLILGKVVWAWKKFE